MIEIIAGPCSWENKIQAETIINFLCENHNIKYIRGGIKKYRSDKSTYQGIDFIDGMLWLWDLKRKHGIKIITEVFSEQDIKEIEFFADILQIGARNGYNTDLLKITNKYKKPVLYKRHYCMGLNEFIAHSKYIENDVIFCLRGDLSLHTNEQRFRVDIADIQRLREMTDKKICYDVSHASCHSRYIEKNTLAACVYQPDFIMLEVHNNPPAAKSDPDQQLNFQQFSNLIKKIKE